jgi:hypothetical protein
MLFPHIFKPIALSCPHPSTLSLSFSSISLLSLHLTVKKLAISTKSPTELPSTYPNYELKLTLSQLSRPRRTCLLAPPPPHLFLGKKIKNQPVPQKPYSQIKVNKRHPQHHNPFKVSRIDQRKDSKNLKANKIKKIPKRKLIH